MRLEDFETGAAARALWVSGAFHEGAETILLLSPGPDFWPRFTADPEYSDGASEPMDRWSARVIGAWATELGAVPLFPFGDDAAPFLSLAKASGRAHASPVHLLVHDDAGLMISYRGGLRIAAQIDLPAPPPAPCTTCAKPCLTACPIGALTAKGYDVPSCRAFLHSEAGKNCMERGCALRRACPPAQAHGRIEAQSAFHMKAFR